MTAAAPAAPVSVESQPASAAPFGGAFSLRDNARALLTPTAHHLRPLDGLRALSILWVVLFHVGWYLPAHLPTDAYVALLGARWMVPLWRGDFGVDVFFVLSGTLIAGLLLDERAATGRIRLGLFYARRLLRLWPALVAALLVEVALVGDHPDMTWANLLYVSNFIPIRHAAMGWTWSLAIEEQFYLVCPWLVALLAARAGAARAAIVGAFLAALAGVAAFVVVRGDFHALDAEIVIARSLDAWAAAFDALYDKPWMRAGPLVVGVGVALLLRAPRFMDRLSRSGVVGAGGLVASVAVAALATHWQSFETASRPVEIAYLAGFRTVFGLGVGVVTLFALSKHPAGVLLSRALSARVLHPIAQLAYAAYLVNPIVTQLVTRAMAPHIQAGGWQAIALLAPLDVAGTFAAAALLHLLVERPFMRMRPSAPSLAPEPATPAATAPAERARTPFFALDLLDNRFPALHGMRFIAIVTVVAYHVTWIFMGEQGIELDPLFFAQALTVFFGMDLFFVLSGFLIGSILLRSITKMGTHDIGRFYVRRIFRTFPTYYLVLAVLAVAFPLTAAQRHHLGWEVLYGTNFLPLNRGQTVMFWGWSLGLEEQFYLTVPLLFVALERLRSAWSRVGLLGALWAAALVIRITIYARHRPWSDGDLYGALYFRTHTRFDPLVAGIILAVIHQAWGKNIAKWLEQPFHRAVVALPSLGLLWLLLRPTIFGVENLQIVHLFAWGTVTSVMYLGIVPLALYTDGAVTRWLGAHTFRRLATLGYGVYLVHIPIIDHVMVPLAKAAQARHWSMLLVWPAALTGTMLGALGIAYALHVLIEKPSLRLRERYAA